METVFHTGELAVQARAGVSEKAARIGRSIHPSISSRMQLFLQNQTFVAVTSTDEKGEVWISILTGPVGFIEVYDPHTVRIDATITEGDPLRENLSLGGAVGLIAIEFDQRARSRLNGTAELLNDGSFLIHAKQVYGNCPKYIQARTAHIVGSTLGEKSSSTVSSGQLSSNQQAWIKEADTFFIGTIHKDEGADASHRGGRNGFVQIIDNKHLLWPEYAGNMMYNTLGNLNADGRAGLIFIDFDHGSLLQLSGKAEIIWDETEISKVEGAERLVSFEI
ncbi:MAG: pyridoxamine 5'-phosphate oxidase family protein, partial [Chloroflexota bacterium]